MTSATVKELEELKYSLLEGLKSVTSKAEECIPGTRATILTEVETKTGDSNGMNILWIRGEPGSGKSSISLSTKSRLIRQGRLVTYFRFDRNESTTTTPAALWRRIAYDLACRFPAICRHVLQELRHRKVDLDSSLSVFASFVEVPLSEVVDLPVDLPLVIIIDALDECGGDVGRLSVERRELLETLTRWSMLPKHKLVVTSREEGDIIRTLSSISTPIQITSGNILVGNPQSPGSVEASNDMRTFLERRFSEIRIQLNEDKDWPGTEIIVNMVHRAAGNFMWATAAMNFIDKGVSPSNRLDRIMSGTPPSSGMEPLYSLYSTILETAFGKIPVGDSEAMTLRAVLGTMICAKRTLSDDEYTELPTQNPISRQILGSIRNNLGSVIATDGNLRFSHKSFDDFLRSAQCPPKYAVNIEESQHLLAYLCVTTMTKKLRFNMCNLETSCLKNTDVLGIDTKVANGIPSLLSYSCCFWADHLSVTSFDWQLEDKVKEMIHEKLLYWFEAMSLLKQLNRVSYSLLSVLKWIHPSPDDEFKDFLCDARQFVGSFGSPIAQSAPHIYISALPFAPKYSPVAQRFLPQFPWTLTVTTGKPTHWSPCVFVSNHHETWIKSVVLSPDQRHYVSGSTDGTICISDFETGNLISGPFRIDDNPSSVFLNPDGQYVWVSCSLGRLISLDIETGDKHLDFNAGDAIGCCSGFGDQKIISVKGGRVASWSADTGIRLHDLPINNWVHLASLSPNNRYIACVACDAPDDGETIRTWKLLDGSEIRLVRTSSDTEQSRQMEPIYTLSFSVDGNFAVGGSFDGSIIIWDAQTGDTTGPLLDARWGSVQAVAYSHENRLLLSAHDDKVIVWDTATCEAAPRTLNNIDGVTSIALSPNGRWALMGSKDGTVRKWDLDRKENVPSVEPSDGHRARVTCLAFSPCGKHLASIGDDRRICFWDVNAGEPLLSPIALGFHRYSKIVFSPDGSRVVTYGAFTGFVGVWDVNTGELVVQHDLRDNNRTHTFISHVAFRSTDQRLVTCSTNGNVHIWGLEDNAPPQVVAKLPRIITLSPDGLTAFVRDNNRNPRHYLWSTVTCQPLPLTLADDMHVGGYMLANSSSTGQFLAVTSHNYQSVFSDSLSILRIWNIETGELTPGPLKLNHKIESLAVSPDGSHIAFTCSYDAFTRTGTSVWICDGRTGHLTSVFWSLHTSVITALAFSPNGEQLVSGSRSGQIRIWNTADLLGNIQVPAGFMIDGVDMRNGWVMVAGGKLGFWVPGDHREKLAWNGSIVVTGGLDEGIVTQVDLTRYRYGENWAQCFEEGK